MKTITMQTMVLFFSTIGNYIIISRFLTHQIALPSADFMDNQRLVALKPKIIPAFSDFMVEKFKCCQLPSFLCNH